MTFYTFLSRYYKQLFPLNTRAAAFIQGLCRKGGCILDAGCGDGALVTYLKAQGLEARGFDLDEAMIANARKGLDAPDIFRTGHLKDAAGLYGGEGPFDLVSCLGNTFVHVPPGEQIDFLKQLRKLLAPAGILVLQSLNYENILYRNLPFPVMERPACRFVREYREKKGPGGGPWVFNTILEDKATGRVYENRLDHYPVWKDSLDVWMELCGFASWEFYGSWEGGPLDKTGLPFILVARNPS